MSFWFGLLGFIAVKMSSHQMSSNKPRSSKCHRFCFPFDTHNYCPSFREAWKGDDPCVTNKESCNICSAFTRFNTSTDELDLYEDDDMEVFSGSQADLEGAAENCKFNK